MPMIDVYAAEGTFTDKHTLAQNLAQAEMRWEQCRRSRSSPTTRPLSSTIFPPKRSPTPPPPEPLWAFRRIWDRVSAVGRVVAIDLPGFGHSDGRPELIAPDASGAFLAGLIDEWGLGTPHVVGPDIGTAAALFLAARSPERVTSLTVGGGAVRFPIEAGGALRDIIEAPSLDVVRGL